MSSIRQGTTPTLTINTDVDLTDYDAIWLTIEDSAGNSVTLDKTQITVTSTAIEATMTQEQTLSLQQGTVVVQVRARLSTNAIASNVMWARLDYVLNDGVI